MARAGAGGVILAAGRGERMGAFINKAFLPLGDRPLLVHSVLTFEAAAGIDAYVVVARPEEAAFCRALLAPYELRKLTSVVAGGEARQESAAAGVRALPGGCSLVAVHDAARPLLSAELLDGALAHMAPPPGRRRSRTGDTRGASPGGHTVEALVVAVPVKETVKVVGESGQITGTPARGGLWVAQTPQIFRRDLLLGAYEAAERDGFTGTDDASLVERLGVAVEVYRGSYDNIKVTTPEDLEMAQALLGRRWHGHPACPAHPAAAVPGTASSGPPPPGADAAGGVPPRPDPESAASARAGAVLPQSLPIPAVRAGIGYDVHPFAPNRPLFLGGVEIADSPGLDGHSDADAALHALMDACLGAAGLPDIGRHFPPGDPRWRDAPSLALLASVRSKLAAAGYAVSQVDLVIAAEAPRLAPYIDAMQQRIAAVLGIPAGSVGIKATTAEGLGFVGRREGIAAWAIATITPRG